MEQLLPLLRCPTCRGALTESQGGLVCPACPRCFEVIHGIPDFRPEPPDGPRHGDFCLEVIRRWPHSSYRDLWGLYHREQGDALQRLWDQHEAQAPQRGERRWDAIVRHAAAAGRWEHRRDACATSPPTAAAAPPGHRLEACATTPPPAAAAGPPGHRLEACATKPPLREGADTSPPPGGGTAVLSPPHGGTGILPVCGGHRLEACATQPSPHGGTATLPPQDGGTGILPVRAALDVGCGAGSALFGLARHTGLAVGLDILLTDLLLAKKRFAEAGIANVAFACASALELPFAADCFALANATDVIEHVPDQGRLLSEVRRVLRSGGLLFFNSPNRFTLLTREPHVKLWGVGWLPRRWMEPYVRWRLGRAYRSKHLLSLRELRRLVRGAFGPHYAIRSAVPRGRLARAVARPFEALARPLLPQHNVVAWKGGENP